MKRISKIFFVSVFVTIGFLSYSLSSVAKVSTVNRASSPMEALPLELQRCAEFYTYSHLTFPESRLTCALVGTMEGSKTATDPDAIIEIDGHTLKSTYECTFDESAFEDSLTNPCIAGTTFFAENTTYYICYSDDRINYGSSVNAPDLKLANSSTNRTLTATTATHNSCADGYEMAYRRTPSTNGAPNDSLAYANKYYYQCISTTTSDHNFNIIPDVCTAKNSVLLDGDSTSARELACCAILEE